ncbi:MAG: hypothetical protein A2161_12740 [Candidatus Schekmanbacteria bacterium RBG_13_48_7]|uniref:Bacterial Pleckstrin homology domain-containing protein n=1 Tax=Candidatus Schekmanbacteria bacterium RBG_13_48_7 TaxID=1817878 RepID=A0A1F7S4A3_9BACT|nr:MAG: hypothetical protein A2161_12740 [Candidatus Schekmanbacteria bacterium RBG_13_48_7]
MTDSKYVIFSEIQRFDQVWIWIPIIFIAGSMWMGFIIQIILGSKLGSKPAPDIVVIIIWILIGIILPFLFFKIKLVTEVRDDGLYIKFHRHIKYSFNEIKTYEACTYRPIREYGGWGIRYGLKGKAYNVKGNRGVQLELTNGKRILIGSQKPEELVMAIDSAKTS